MSTKTKNHVARGIGLLQEWVNKLGGRDALSEDERQTYSEYYDILNRELAIEDLIPFLRNEVATLQGQLQTAVKNSEDRKALYITARIENYQNWLDFMEAPEREKEALIEHITNEITNHSHGN